ncbi:VOC family protein, partial [Streptomyces sparsus]
IGDAGGKALLEPTPIGTDGTLLVAADPGGTAFGAWQAAGHAGFEIQGEHGSFFWPEVYTRAKGDVDPFYEKALGYSAQQVSDDAAFDFAVYTLPGNPAPVVGRLQMGEHFPAEMPAHMLVYFRVDDCDAAVAAVRRLGGSVEREPTDTPFGRSALVADDQGARFALMGPTAS